MSVIVGPATQQGSATNTAEFEYFSGPIHPISLEVGGTVYVYVAGWYGEGIQVFEMDEGGDLTPRPDLDVPPLPDGSQSTAPGLSTVTVEGKTFVLFTSLVFETLTTLEVGEDGSLTIADVYDDPFNTDFWENFSPPTSFQVDGKSFVAAAGYFDDGLSIFEISGDGTLTLTDSLHDTDLLLGADTLSVVEVGGMSYMLATAFLGDSLTSYTISSDGIATFADTLEDTADLELFGAGGIGTVEIDGTVYAIVTAFDDGGVQVVEVGADGSLTPVFALDQSDLPAEFQPALEAPWGVETFKLEELDMVAINGQFGNRVGLFHIGADGSLAPVSISGAGFEPALVEPALLSFSEHFDTPFLLVGSNLETFHNLEIGGGDDVLSGGEAGDTILGLGGDDSLFGNGGADLIDGGVGDDLILGGDGQDSLIGQLGQDEIQGGNGGDVLTGNAYDDSLFGQAGADRLFGGAGRDTVNGGGGEDMLRGGDGRDRIVGGRDDDVLHGGSGVDHLIGGHGADILNGNGGEDELNGGGGKDRLFGGGGDDVLTGGGWDDLLKGGNGDDRLNGGVGDDTLIGDAGADQFVFKDFRASDRDIVEDFEDGIDMLLFKGATPLDFRDVASGVLVEFASGYDILVKGWSSDQVDGGDWAII